MGYTADADSGRNAMRRVEVIEVDDSGPIMKVTVMGLADEIFELSLRGQPHGLTTVPVKGAIGYGFSPNGRPDQFFLMGLESEDNRKQFNGRTPGESTVYAKKGQEIYMKDNGDVDIKSPHGVVHINPP